MTLLAAVAIYLLGGFLTVAFTAYQGKGDEDFAGLVFILWPAFVFVEIVAWPFLQLSKLAVALGKALRP